MIRSQTFKTNQVFKIILEAKGRFKIFIEDILLEPFRIVFDCQLILIIQGKSFRLATDLHFFEINGPNWGSY